MKLLFCEDCGDILAPNRVNHQPRWCSCGSHAIWWEDGARGIAKFYSKFDAKYMKDMDLRYPRRPRAYGLGITNLLLSAPSQSLRKEDYKAIVDAHDDYYLFKRCESVMVRFRPGETTDTSWATDLPGTETYEVKVVVNGQATQIEFGANSLFSAIKAKALDKTDNTAEPFSQWELKDEEGNLLDLFSKVDKSVKDKTLFLSLRAGTEG